MDVAQIEQETRDENGLDPIIRCMLVKCDIHRCNLPINDSGQIRKHLNNLMVNDKYVE